jgi:hypothetical protein
MIELFRLNFKQIAIILCITSTVLCQTTNEPCNIRCIPGYTLEYKNGKCYCARPCVDTCPVGFTVNLEQCRCDPIISMSSSSSRSSASNSQAKSQCSVICSSGFQANFETCRCDPVSSASPFPSTSAPRSVCSGCTSSTSPQVPLTSARTPSICQRRKCKPGYLWEQSRCDCTLHCDVIQDCGPEEKWDLVTCTCIRFPKPLSPRSQPSSLCAAQPCPYGYDWMSIKGVYECFLTCSTYEECPNGQKWDYIGCRCVFYMTTVRPWQPSNCWITCPRGYRVDLENCECIYFPDDPEHCEMNCPPDSVPDYELCYCAPRQDVTPKPRLDCRADQCPQGYRWSQYSDDLCTCEINCNVVKDCPVGQRWSLIKCACVADVCSSSSSSFDVSSSRIVSTISSSRNPSASCQWQPCPTGYYWGLWGGCQCDLACDYKLECPPGQEWDFIECGCVGTPVPSTDSSSSPSCIPQTCPRGYIWGLWGGCECYLACDYIMECPPGQEWDFIECGCVGTPAPSSSSSAPPCDVTCSEGFVANVAECRCDLIISSCKPHSCPRGYSWIQGMCGCDLNCQVPMSCPFGKIWNATECSCIPVLKEPEDCASWHVYNETTCQCECRLEPCECVDGFYFNDYYCDCLPVKPSCSIYCEQPLILDEFFCECLEKPCDKTCPPGYVFDVTNCTSCSSCNCTIDEQVTTPEPSSVTQCSITCQNSNFIIDYETCSCRCELTSCLPGQILDEKFCECIGASCNPIECGEGYVFDEITCQCVKDSGPNCEPGYVYDNEACSCICDHHQNCPLNFVFDENTCDCVCPLGEVCEIGFVFNSDVCGCVCEEEYICQEGFYFDNSTCTCSCLQQGSCENGMIWDDKLCSCVHDHSPKCDPGFVYDQELCDCVCEVQLKCDKPKIFDEKTCQCACQDESLCRGVYDHNRCLCINRLPSPIG